MVSFICDHCQETVKKPKAEAHVRRCYPPSLSCVDCSVSFNGNAFKQHTSCMSEAEKYQGALYRPTQKQQQQQKKQQQQQKQPSNQANKSQQQSVPPRQTPTPAASEQAPASPEVTRSQKRAAEDAAEKPDAKKKVKSDKPTKSESKESELNVEAMKTVLDSIGSHDQLTWKALTKQVVKQLRKTNSSWKKDDVKAFVEDHLKLKVSGSVISFAFTN